MNPLVYNKMTGDYESPHIPEDFAIYPFVETSLRLLKDKGYMTVLVSNQPSYAKGKATMENILRIGKLLEDFSYEHGGLIDQCYYCYHHPHGVIPEYTCLCQCRKPGTLFLEEAAKKYALNPEECWFIGDSDSDIECGRRFGCGTVKINNPHSPVSGDRVNAHFYMDNLYQAAVRIINLEGNRWTEIKRNVS
jgi:D-glycero-D-manno-heptose 1,7-bisphosphate phosphatase